MYGRPFSQLEEASRRAVKFIDGANHGWGTNAVWENENFSLLTRSEAISAIRLGIELLWVGFAAYFGPYRRGPATPVARLSTEGSAGQKWRR
jgi:hypothetical protein